MKRARMIEATPDNVERAFARAYLGVQRTELPSLYVYDGIEMPTWVGVKGQQKAICLTAYVELNAALRRVDDVFLNESNADYLFPAFFVRGDKLWARHAVDVTFGFQPGPLVVTLRRFSAGFAAAIRECELAPTTPEWRSPPRLHS